MSDLPPCRPLWKEMTDAEVLRVRPGGDITFTVLSDGRIGAHHSKSGQYGVGGSYGQAIDDLQPPTFLKGSPS